MLVIANGAFRSGSTWLAQILRSIIKSVLIPQEYHNTAEWKPGTSIHPKKLKKFLEKIDYKHTNFVSKNHLGKNSFRNTILTYEDVFVVDIDRDIRDTITSGYYYHQRRKEFNGDFKDYYWKKGRYIADYIRRYHDVWRTDSPRIFISSYERLKTDYLAEVYRIGSFLGVKLSDHDLERIQQETDINKLRQKWQEDGKPEGERFFRKGVIGDWQNHFDNFMLADLHKIQEKGLGKVERLFMKARILWNRIVRHKTQ